MTFNFNLVRDVNAKSIPHSFIKFSSVAFSLMIEKFSVAFGESTGEFSMKIATMSATEI